MLHNFNSVTYQIRFNDDTLTLSWDVPCVSPPFYMLQHKLGSVQLSNEIQLWILKKAKLNCSILPLSDVPLEHVEGCDAGIHPVKKTNFFQRVIIPDATEAFVVIDNLFHKVIGYGVLRQGNEGWGFRPKYADTDDVGHELMRILLDQAPDGTMVTVCHWFPWGTGGYISDIIYTGISREKKLRMLLLKCAPWRAHSLHQGEQYKK